MRILSPRRGHSVVHADKTELAEESPVGPSGKIMLIKTSPKRAGHAHDTGRYLVGVPEGEDLGYNSERVVIHVRPDQLEVAKAHGPSEPRVSTETRVSPVRESSPSRVRESSPRKVSPKGSPHKQEIMNRITNFVNELFYFYTRLVPITNG